MTLAEMSPEIEGNQEDVVTRLAFVCTVCGPKAIFPTSPFSKTYPTNYSLNKLLLPLLGPSSYFHLSQFLQHNPDAPQEILTSGTFSHQKPQLLVSVDHAFFDFTRPFDPPLPSDPDTNLVQGKVSHVFLLIKFIYSEKATKFCEIFPLLFTTVHTVKSKGKISQNFVAFSEYMDFM